MSRTSKPLASLFIWLLVTASLTASAQTRKSRVAILDLGPSETGQRVSELIGNLIRQNSGLELIDKDESTPAAKGIGYTGSLNLSLEDARNLGAAMGCEFYIIGDAQTLRRSSSTRPIFFESYASVFVVSARTGRLISWERPSFEASTTSVAEKMLLDEIDRSTNRQIAAMRAAEIAERNERELSNTSNTPVIEEVPDESSPLAKGLRLPQPYRRLRPAYPETAARAEAKATVDILVDLDVEGEVVRTEIVRWAGFGLDEETVNTVRRMHFRPAMRDGVAIPMRVLLRYNFARPKKQNGNERSGVAS